MSEALSLSQSDRACQRADPRDAECRYTSDLFGLYVQNPEAMARLVDLDLSLQPSRPLCVMAGAEDALRVFVNPAISWVAPNLTRLDFSGRQGNDDLLLSIASMAKLKDLNLNRILDFIVMGASVRQLSQLTQLTRLGCSHCLTAYNPGLSGTNNRSAVKELP
jgi:hypothetical protein